MNATATLVTRAAARQAAAFVVDHDAAAPPAGRRLFTRTAVDDVDPAHVRAELAELHARIYSELVDPDDPCSTTARRCSPARWRRAARRGGRGPRP